MKYKLNFRKNCNFYFHSKPSKKLTPFHIIVGCLLAFICFFNVSCGKIWGNLKLYNQNPSLSCPSSPLNIGATSAIYPINGANWNDYVTVGNPTLDNYSQIDNPCLGTETGYWGCIHGGEKKVVALPSAVTSCNGIIAQDSLGAFQWVCKMVSGSATIYSAGLNTNMGLKNLINTSGTSFLPISVSVFQNNCLIAQNSPTIWWSNNFIPLPDNSGGPGVIALSTSHAIYTLASSRASYGYNITNNNVGVVILSGATLTNSNPGVNCFFNTGKDAGGSNNLTAPICLGTESFDWIEGNIDGTGGIVTNNIFTRPVNFTVFAQSTFSNGNGANFRMIGSKNSFFKNLISLNAQGAGIDINGGTNNLIMNLFASGNSIGGAGAGFSFLAGTGNRSYNLVASGNHNYGLYLGENLDLFVGLTSINNGLSAGAGALTLFISTNSIFVNALIANNAGTGLFINQTGATNNTLLGITAVSNSSKGANNANGASNNDLINFAAVNNGNDGINATDNGGGVNPSGNVYAELASTNNGGYGINFKNGVNQSVTQYLLVKGNTSGACNVFGGASSKPGVVTGTCTDTGLENSNTYATEIGGASSSATLHINRDLTSSFVGPVSTTDPSNLTNLNGLEAFASVTDWLNFSNIFRGWGLNGGYPLNGADTGVCNVGNCRIWDWRLSANDITIRNTSFDGVNQNASFVVGGACPASVNGNVAITDQTVPSHTFLLNAYEIVNDSAHNPNGNNNGLCESGEACIYMPNIGYYQGEGDPFSQGTCTFQNGTVTNVQMYAYPTNGN